MITKTIGVKRASFPEKTLLAAAIATVLAGMAPCVTRADTVIDSSNSPTTTQTWTSGNYTVESGGSVTSTGGAALQLVSAQVGALTNDGSISGTGTYTSGLANSGGTINVLTNNGSLSGEEGIGNSSGATITTLNNTDIITGRYAGIYNGALISSLTNSGTISGTPVGNGASGTGILNEFGTIGTLTNTGTISGANVGIENAFGTITTLNNSGTISGVSGNGIGINNPIGTITTLNNESGGTISGGLGGIFNSSTIATLNNAGLITETATVSNATPAAAISNSGSIGVLTNTGTISGAVYAIYNVGSATLGSITNSGTIAGNILNGTTQDLTINGGAGTTFGTLTGYNGTVGTITSSNGTPANVVFASGNLLLNDNIDVSIGPTTNANVNNTGATLQVNTPITITGNYNQTAGTLQVGAVSSTQSGELVVSGNTTMTGGAVNVVPAGYALAAGQRYIVVDTAGTATYGSALTYSATGFAATGASVTSGAHSDLVVTLGASTTPPSTTTTPPSTTTTTTTSPTLLATAPNSVAAIKGLGNYTGYNAKLMNLQNAMIAVDTYGTAASANRAGVQLAPSNPSAGAQAAAAPTFDVLQIVSSHADSLRLGQADGSGASGISTGDAAPLWGVWGQAFGGHAGQGQVDQVDGYSANYGGLMIGADRAIGDRWHAGGVFSYSNTLVDGTENSAGDSTRVNGYGLIGYASYTGSPWYVNLSGGIVQQRFDSARNIDFTGFSGIANGQFSGQQYVASAEAGWPLAVGTLTLTPLASLTYSYEHQNAYAESGGDGAALSVDAAHSTSVRSALGGKLERSFGTTYGEIVPDLQLEWVHEYDHTKLANTASFAADPTGQTAFTTVGSVPVSNLADMSLGVTVLKSNNLSLTARYELQAGAHFVSQTGSLRLRQLF